MYELPQGSGKAQGPNHLFPPALVLMNVLSTHTSDTYC